MTCSCSDSLIDLCYLRNVWHEIIILHLWGFLCLRDAGCKGNNSTLYASLNKQHMNGAAGIRMHQSQPTIMIKIEQCYYTTSLCYYTGKWELFLPTPLLPQHL